MDIITSKENILIKETRKLFLKKYRDENQQFLIEGFRLVEEACISNCDISKLFVDIKQAEKLHQYRILNDTDENKVFYTNSEVLKSISSTKNPQGIVGIVNNKVDNFKICDGFYIMLDSVQDPGNIGTIIRSADASGAAGVILTKGCGDPYNEKTIRSTMGSLFHLPIITIENLELIYQMKDQGFKLIVSALQGADNYFKTDFCQNTLLVVGNEGNGVSEDIIKIADSCVKIPMPGKAESLNVSAAASVMLFEVVRQKMIDKI